MPQPISQPTYPSNMTEGDLSFSKLMDVLIADFVYFGIGTYDQLSLIFPSYLRHWGTLK